MEDLNSKAPPEVRPGDWIVVGRSPLGSYRYDAVVCALTGHQPGWVEVVYLERVQPVPRRKRQPVPRALQSWVVWKDGRWEWARDYPNEGYADHYDRLAEFVRVLRSGPPRP